MLLVALGGLLAMHGLIDHRTTQYPATGMARNAAQLFADVPARWYR